MNNEIDLGVKQNKKARPFSSRDYKNNAPAMTEEEWLGVPPEFDFFDEEIESDVIICGAGIAGVAAARAAAEEGATVILFEKSKTIQARSGDFGTIGSRVSARWGRDSKENISSVVADLMSASNYRADHRILKYWAEHSGEDLDWYIEAHPDLYISNYTLEPIPDGVKCALLPERYPLPKHYNEEEEYFRCYQLTCRFRPSHYPVLKSNMEKAEASGRIRAYYQTPVKKLLREGGGKVQGVVAVDINGKIIKAAARNGVVLSTGDYSGNLDMLYYYCPWTRLNPTFFTSVDADNYYANTGDGHKMGMWIGAMMENNIHAASTHQMGGPFGISAFLQLNINGERFMNEDCDGQKLDNKICTIPGATSWQIVDGGWREQLPYMSATHGSTAYFINSEDIEKGIVSDKVDPGQGYASQAYLDAALTKGTTIQADRLEELIEKTGLPKETALKSIERYNELARKGVDLDFGKRASRMFPIEKPPFYATRFQPAPLFNVSSGLVSDHEAHCYDKNWNIIPGLYVAGNVQGNRFGVEYPVIVPGISHSMALTYGRLAGKNAALGI